MSILATLAGGLLQGFFANRERQNNLEDVRQQFVRLREGAELAGFNPLAVLGTASGMPNPSVSAGSYMGTALADTAMLIAADAAKKQNAGTLNRVNALEAENRDLLGRLTQMTLRPKVPGIYGGGDGARGPGGPVVAGGEFSRGPAGSPPYWRPALGLAVQDNRRDVQFTDVINDPGYSVIDNPWIKPFAVPTYNGELVGPGEAATMLGGLIVDRVGRLASKLESPSPYYFESGGMTFGLEPWKRPLKYPWRVWPKPPGALR